MRGLGFRYRWLLASAAASALLTPTVAHAAPLAAVAAAVAAAFTGGSIVAAIGNFLVSAAITWGLSKLSPSRSASARDRQASVSTLSVGEVPREMLVGEAGTGGSLVDGYYYGGANGTDWNVLVISVADHRCHSLVGFHEGENYREFTGDGYVAGYNNQLRVFWRSGSASDPALPGDLAGLGPATAPDALRGVAHVVVAYKADAPDAKNPIWTTGRPSFVWVVKGLLCYIPRKDDTVPGGSGPHRWDDPSTREWTDNAEDCRYNYSRGTYFLDQVNDPGALMVGRGLSVYEAPPERNFAPANLCDELVEVTNAATGVVTTEPRYRVGGVIAGDQPFDTVEQLFADAMGGFVIQPEGGVAVEPGQAKTPEFEITDGDLVGGSTVQWSDFVSDSDRVNSVVVSYVEPDQKWAMTTAGVLRDDADIAQDRGPKETALPLSLVRHRSQALRIGEIKRRGARLEKRGAFTLPPEYAGLEEGDWINYTSDRRTGGVAVTMRVTKYQLNEAWQNTVFLEQTAYSVYGFGGPEVVPPEVPPVIPVGALALAGVTAAAIFLEGDDESLTPAVQFTWTVPVDAAITSIRAEVRMVGQTAVTPTSTTEVSEGLLNVTAGVPSAGNIEVRLVPLGTPGRAITPSPWIPLTAGTIYYPPVVTPPDTTPPSAPSALTYEASLGTIFLYWQNPPEVDVDKVEVWVASANDRASATRVGIAGVLPDGSSGFPHSGLPAGATRYYWLRAVDRTGNLSDFYPLSATAGFAATTASLEIADFPSDLAPIGIYPTLPNPVGYTGPKVIRVAADGKVWRYVGSNWVTGTAASDISGSIADGQIAALSAFKLAGTIVDTQISSGAVTTPKLAAGAVTTSRITAGAVTASEVAAGSISGDRLQAGTISSAYIATNAITATQLAANSVTAAKIQAGVITADRLVTGQIDTYYIKPGAIANAGVTDWSGHALIGTSLGAVGTSLSIEVRGSFGVYTTILVLVYIDASNDDLVNAVGLWTDLAVNGLGLSFLAGGASALVHPGNPANICVPIYIRVASAGYLTLTAGAFANLTGPYSQLYATRVKIVPLAIYNS